MTSASWRDLWAVGTALRTMLSGVAVTRGSLATMLPDAPPELVRFVDRALAPDPDDRWPNARAMRDALDAVLTGIHQFHAGLGGAP